MLWLALRFPSLPLDIFRRAAQANDAFAVRSAEGARAAIVACNATARSKDVQPGMQVAAAMALDAHLQVVLRDAAAEQAALERVAAWALQFTPVVSLAPPGAVLLEIEGSLHLFGGLNGLRRRVAEGMSALGYRAVIAIAPTPLAALWFSRADAPVRIRHADALQLSLAQLPVSVLDLPPDAARLLEDLGVATLGDCLVLPRSGLARRLGQNVLDMIDRAAGRLPDPRPRYAPPTVYAASQPLPAPAQEAEMLLFAARRLLVELCGFLSATAQGVQRLQLTLSHERRGPTQLTLSLVAASRDAEHLLNVLRERLDATALPCPAVAIALRTELLLPVAARSASMLPDPSREAEAAARLVERLRARLGEDGVVGLRTVNDYRPERGWHVCEPGTSSATAIATDSRPLWLLTTPRSLEEKNAVPCYEGRLALLAGPERIETGWWDDRHVERDYFVASNPAHSLLWIYKERHAGGKWYLHGYFAALWLVVAGCSLLAAAH
jgi:protein ImuB